MAHTGKSNKDSHEDCRLAKGSYTAETDNNDNDGNDASSVSCEGWHVFWNCILLKNINLGLGNAASLAQILENTFDACASLNIISFLPFSCVLVEWHLVK